MTKCPHCKTAEHVRLSTGHHTLDDTVRHLNLYPFRCDACRARFYRFAKSKPAVPVYAPDQRRSA